MSFLKDTLSFVLSALRGLVRYAFFVHIFLLFVCYYSAYFYPGSFILLPLFSLLFPVFLFLNLLWMIFFIIFFRFKKFIVALFVQLFFLSEIKKYYNVSFPDEIKDADYTISVMSFNVKLFDLYNWQNNHQTRQKIFEYLKKHPADIMCFQEFYTSEDSNDFNNLQDLQKIFPDRYFHYEYFVTIRKNDHWGLLTISKYPIIKKSVIHFNNAKNNGCIYSDVLFNKDTIRVFNLHLQSYNLYKKKKWRPNQKPDDENFYQALDSTAKGTNLLQKIFYNNILKIQQAESILKVNENCKYPTIIAGDFNDIPHSYLMRMIGKKYKDAFVEKGNGWGITYHDKIYLRIDYIFHDQQFHALDFDTENTDETKYLSDHYPIRSILRLKKSEIKKE